jgi:iron complex transport system substrate-binding protein
VKSERWVTSSGACVFAGSLIATLLAVAPPRVAPPENLHATDEPPQRVVVLPPLLAAYATIDGGLTHIVGASDFIKHRFEQDFLSRIYTGVYKLRSVGGIGLTDPELVLSLHPDAVIVWQQTAAAARELGLSETILLGDYPLDARLREWSTLGVVSGNSDKAQRLIDQFQAQRNELEKSLDSTGLRPRIVFFNGAVGGLGYVGGKDHYLNGALAFLHARNAAASLRWGHVDLETIATIDPDIIFLDSTLSQQDPRQLYASRAWSIVRAVRDKRVYLMPQFNFWAPPLDEHLILQWLAEILYPDMPQTLREAYRAAFLAIHNVSLDEDELDQLLVMEKNADSESYARFSRVSTASRER